MRKEGRGETGCSSALKVPKSKQAQAPLIVRGVAGWHRVGDSNHDSGSTFTGSNLRALTKALWDIHRGFQFTGGKLEVQRWLNCPNSQHGIKKWSGDRTGEMILIEHLLTIRQTPKLGFYFSHNSSHLPVFQNSEACIFPNLHVRIL